VGVSVGTSVGVGDCVSVAFSGGDVTVGPDVGVAGALVVGCSATVEVTDGTGVSARVGDTVEGAD
jgi:hypothetical protein